MHRRRGFTLIELLVVIAIIALLMGILMPALSRVKKQARTVACQALLKQWGTIWSMYCDDNDGRFPEAGDLGWKRGTWVIAFRDSYRTKSEMVLCPSAAKRRPTGTTGVEAWGDSTHSYIQGSGGIFNSQEVASYGGNNWTYYARDPSGTGAIQGRPIRWNWKTKDTSNSTNIPIFADAMWRGGGPCYRTSDSGALNPSFTRIRPPDFDGQWLGYGYEMMHFTLKRHQTGTNVLFLDWSVRAVGLKELWTLKWHRQYPINGPLTKAGGVQPSSWPDWMSSFKDY
ncbi:MAG: prepilin-type N-terminal cleavage/methylation domain-containing protein [Phycisphaerae bacterium]|nr:prepilin-type N-terminal cleavage/methylation domain-containing protein [Phycisphaerae bacterium]